jgi:modulator of FtsH protease HflK
MMRFLLVLAGVGLLLYSVGTALTQVQPGERAVVRRFGRMLPDKPGPGLYRGLPWGMEQVDRVPVGRVRRITVGYVDEQEPDPSVVPVGQLLTGDHNLVNVQAEIYYKVSEDNVEQFALQSDRVDGLVARAAESALAEWIAGRNVDEVLVRGKVLLPAHLQAEVQERLKDYQLGVEIEQASVTQLFPPNEVKDAFDRLAQAQTEIRTKVNRAEQEAERRRNEARADIYQLQRQAAAYVQEQKLKSSAEAESFGQRLAQYRKLTKDNPNYLNQMWLDEMTRLYAKMQESGRVDLLDSTLSGEGLNITQFPLQPKKK